MEQNFPKVTTHTNHSLKKIQRIPRGITGKKAILKPVSFKLLKNKDRNPEDSLKGGRDTLIIEKKDNKYGRLNVRKSTSKRRYNDVFKLVKVNVNSEFHTQ